MLPETLARARRRGWGRRDTRQAALCRPRVRSRGPGTGAPALRSLGDSGGGLRGREDETGRERIPRRTRLKANSLVRRLCAHSMTGASAPRRGQFPRRVSGPAPAAAHAGRARLHPCSKRGRRRALPAL